MIATPLYLHGGTQRVFSYKNPEAEEEDPDSSQELWEQIEPNEVESVYDPYEIKTQIDESQNVTELVDQYGDSPEFKKQQFVDLLNILHYQMQLCLLNGSIIQT